jgi:hypothetical protein
MAQNQFGEPATPASSFTQAGEEVNVGITAEEQLNLSIKKLEQVCRKTGDYGRGSSLHRTK